MPNNLIAKCSTRRTSAGLIVTDATVTPEQGIGWVDSPGIYNDAQVAGWQMTNGTLPAATTWNRTVGCRSIDGTATMCG